MRDVLSHIGVTNNPFFTILSLAMDEGEVSVVTNNGLGTPFTTSRGIKQGCPASPLLFALLLTGLQRRLTRLQLPGLISFDTVPSTLTSYADDLKLFAYTAEGLDLAFEQVSLYLNTLGLSSAADKGFALGIGTKGRELLHIAGCDIPL